MIRSIFSIDQRGGMGNKGSLPWANDPEDMQWFKDATKGHVVVMGRRTWDDPKMPKPLPDRINIVLTNGILSSPSNLVYRQRGDPLEVIGKIAQQWKDRDVWIIGGADLIAQTKDLCDEMWVAHRKGAYFTDVRLDIGRYFAQTRITSSVPNDKRTINWCTYKNVDLFRPL